MRPESFKYFESVGERCLLDLAEQREAGTKVVGVYCLFAPTELIRAAGAIPVSLCGKKEAPIPHAEKVLPVNLCPLIKSSYGYAMTDTCPYFSASDLLVGETTCDGKKKMFEFLGRIKPLFLMHLPHTSEGDGALRYWLSEILALRDFLETHTGIKVEPKELRKQITIHNRIRKLVRRISDANAGRNVLLSGLDMMTVMETKSFSVDLDDYLLKLEQFAGQLDSMATQEVTSTWSNAPRILLTGCPAGKGSEKVLRLIEECGGIVVCQENCTGVKGLDLLVDESQPDPFLALAQRYLRIPCSCITPNSGRLALLRNLIEEYRIDGVVDLTWQCCHTYNIESRLVGDMVEANYNLPFLHLETDYSNSDIEQLRTRIEAFLEMADWHCRTEDRPAARSCGS
ncbi:MAG: double-cubane-cluster-containing anaerobic reductase [Syntrophobacter sp.]